MNRTTADSPAQAPYASTTRGPTAVAGWRAGGPGGGIVVVSPGKGGLGTFAPGLDTAAKSVMGQLAAAFLSHQLGLDLFVSEPG